MTDTTNIPRGRFVHGGMTLRPAELPDPRLAEGGSVFQDPAGQYWRLVSTPVGRRAERGTVQHWSRATPISEDRYKQLKTVESVVVILGLLAAAVFFFTVAPFGPKGLTFDSPAAVGVTVALITIVGAFLTLTLYLGRTVKLSEAHYREWRIEQRELARIRRGLPALEASRGQDTSAGGES